METETITITLEKETVACKKGMTLYELSREYQKNYEYPIIVAKCDGVIRELYHEVPQDAHVEFCTTKDKDGARVYFRGISMILLKAIYKEIPRENIERVSFEMNEELLRRIEMRMRKYVAKDIPFEKKVIRTRDAGRLFEELHMHEKGKLMQYRKNSRMTVYHLGKFTDYYYGAMPYSTSILQYFKLDLFEDGFVFIIPNPTARSPCLNFLPA